MINYKEHDELVRKAQLGDKECLNRLAEAARVHLREYVLRLTLREDLTQDIVQESILEMFKVFDKLKRAEKFWSWLDGIAFNKIRSHYGRQWRHKTISLSDIDREVAIEDSQSALADMVNRELKQIVLISMRELSPRYRAVLTMRCYKDMPYSEIAGLMGCTEFGAQSLFYRAKKALAKKLSRHGLGKGYLLTALVLFGKLTASTEAAAASVSVTSATLKVSAAASLAAMVTSKTAVVSMVTTAAITGGAMVVTLGTDMIDIGPERINAQTSFNSPGRTEAGKGMEQCWYFFPEGPGRPVMMRMLKFNVSGKNSYCRNLQNQHANYYYDKNTIYVNNFRMYSPDLSVTRLPTDGEDLSRFISQVEGRQADMERVSSRGKGLLVISKRSSEQGDRIWRTDRHFNVLEEEYFQFNWPQDERIVDNRDQMHKRGWTYFRITGRINGQQVSGTGRMPFVYAASGKSGPWLELRLSDGTKIIDSASGACVFDRSGKTVASYAAGSFFKGLGRPWMGLHTIDTVRRDAAEKQVWFETKHLQGGAKAEIVLTKEQIRLVYTIDMETDVIEKITFSASNGRQGELEFFYLQNIDNPGNEFTSPRIGSHRRPQRNPPGMLWIAALFNSRL
ncbi:MAG: RNA polymerase sigma factor [Sedimentisphaerales bacterium]